MSEEPKRLFLVDGMALLFRSFYAMGSNLSAPDGTPVGAMYGFLRIVGKIIKDQKPTHLAVCWDRQEPTFRHEMYPSYKANRSEPPAEIIPQIKLIKELLPKSGIACLSLAGYEGDDLIGTIATRFSNPGDNCFETHGESYIVSSDKDFMQLVNERIKMVSLKKGDDYVVLGREHVEEYFGVRPDQVIDFLAIRGDAVDNIPGIRGVGEKTAAKLLNEFGSLDALLANPERIANKKVQEAIRTNPEIALLCRKLATIHLDVPIECDEALLRFDPREVERRTEFKDALESMRMGSLVKMFYPEAAAAAAAAAKSAKAAAKAAKPKVEGESLDADDATPPAEGTAGAEGAGEGETHADDAYAGADWGSRRYVLVDTLVQLKDVCARMASPQTKCFAFDTETTGLDLIEDMPIGFSVCFEPHVAYYIPAPPAPAQGAAAALSEPQDLFSLAAASESAKEETPAERSAAAPGTEFSAEEAWSALRSAFRERSAVAVAHNLKFDAHQLLNVGVELGDAPIACSMVAAWLANPVSGGYGLDALTLREFGLRKIPTSDLIGKKAGRKTMLEVPLAQIVEYACEDVDAAFRLWEREGSWLAPEAFSKLFWELEMPLLRVLVDMERAGVHVDTSYLNQLAFELGENLQNLEIKLFEMAGGPFKVTSPKQLGEVMFDKLKIHEQLGFKGKLQKTSIGYKTDVGVLEQFSEHPFVKLIEEHREQSKLLGTYVIALPTLVKPSTGRIHTSYHQIGTATGRLSSTDPNLQNIPIRTDWGKRVRAAVCASTDQMMLISADYSQVELRVLAHLAQDETMLEAFRNGADIHRETAAKILGKAPAEVTPTERNRAKAINFGIIYGMGAQRLAREQEISLAEAKGFIERYFLNFSSIRAYLDAQRVHAHEHGFVSTLFGRVRPIPSINSKNMGEQRNSENIAINSPIQGTAADIMKMGMLRVQRLLRERRMKTRLLLQVHDELVLEGPADEVDSVSSLLKEAMEGAVSFAVPLTADVGKGRNWLEAK